MAKFFLIRPGGYQDLIIICVVGILTVILSIYFPGTLPLAFLAFFCVFFAPGWALASYLFPAAKPATGGEEYSEMTLPLRVAASVALSVLLFAIGSLILAWSPLGLTEEAVLLETLVLTVGLSALAIWRRSSLAPGEGLSLSIDVPGRGERLNRLERAILVIAVAGMLFAAALAVDGLLKERQGDPFSELFITGTDGKVSSLPQRLTVGAEGTVQVHVSNQMGSAVDYVLTIGIPVEEGFTNVTASEWTTHHALVAGDGYRYEFTMVDGQDMVGEFIFSIGSPGSFKVLFTLDFADDALDTWLWVTVT